MASLMRYVSPIDTHVHLRGAEYKDFSYEGMNFMALAFRDARAGGLAALIEMPNLGPQLLDSETISERLEEADRYKGDIYHGVYAGTTKEERQVREVASLARELRHWGRIKGLKIFHVDSTGNMGITEHDQQRMIWRSISSRNPWAVVTNHLEDKEEFTGEFDYTNPVSHSLRQNSKSELVQAERQIKNARDAGFEGTFIAAHTSNPETIEYLVSEKNKLPFQVAIEMTWHHMLLNTNDYVVYGNFVKMNPPLRSKEEQERNLEHVLRGNVTMIGTDHAPHPLEKKNSSNPPSGIPAIAAWPLGIAFLRKAGIRERLLQEITFENANRILDLRLPAKEVEVEYNPELWNAYGENPFERIERHLR